MKHHDEQPKIQTYRSIKMALAGATGISSGSTHTIAQLLLRGFNDKELLSLKDARLQDQQVIEGKTCHSVQGRLSRAKINIRLSIDADTLMLRQLITDFDDFTSIEVRRNIRMNGALGEELFARTLEGDP